MEKITLTLTLDIATAQKVLAFLSPLESAIEVPKTNDITKQVEVLAEPIKAAPTAGKKTSMPSFGRTKEQIEAFAKLEAIRVGALDEEAELKAQRTEDRAERKALKDQEEADKLAVAKKLNDEVAEIKALQTTPSTTEMPKKPWDLRV